MQRLESGFLHDLKAQREKTEGKLKDNDHLVRLIAYGEYLNRTNELFDKWYAPLMLPYLIYRFHRGQYLNPMNSYKKRPFLSGPF